MSQVFVVVKPEDDNKLRVGVMSRKTVAEFAPAMPINPSFEVWFGLFFCLVFASSVSYQVDTPAGRDVFRSFLLSKVLAGFRLLLTKV
jgi:hypothetical protein